MAPHTRYLVGAWIYKTPRCSNPSLARFLDILRVVAIMRGRRPLDMTARRQRGGEEGGWNGRR